MMTSLGGWLLTLLGAPDALIGDLHEGCARRSSLWYWAQVGAFASRALGRALLGHPVRAAWLGALMLMAAAAVIYLGVETSRLPIDRAVKLEVLSSGWLASAAADGRVRVVPAVRVLMTNQSRESLQGLQLNAIFRRSGDGSAWGDRWWPALERLPPGGMRSLLVTSPNGHVSVAPAEAMLRHSQFVDARVELFGRQASGRWARLGAFDVRRTMVEPER